MARKSPASRAAADHSAIIGYARTSTIEQTAGLAAQERDLAAAGCRRVFAEQVSSVATARPQLEAALAYLRAGDVLVATKPDRLARSTADLLGIVQTLKARDIGLRILSMGGGELDTRSPTGMLMVTMLGAVAAFERELMLERQREGIRRAVEAGKYKGRKPTARARAGEVAELVAQGVGATAIARRLGIGRASVYRILSGEPAA
jgi:DNA invertase Pin-like site-specific DNA recombinase